MQGPCTLRHHPPRNLITVGNSSQLRHKWQRQTIHRPWGLQKVKGHYIVGFLHRSAIKRPGSTAEATWTWLSKVTTTSGQTVSFLFLAHGARQVQSAVWREEVVTAQTRRAYQLADQGNRSEWGDESTDSTHFLSRAQGSCPSERRIGSIIASQNLQMRVFCLLPVGLSQSASSSGRQVALGRKV